MFWSKDIVAEQSQTAPLLNKLSGKSGAKRTAEDAGDNSEIRAKKKRESLLNIVPSCRAETSTSQCDDNSMPSITDDHRSLATFTVCSLCDLHFQTELELEEHLYSLLHHRALDTEKGKEFVHECNLCCKKCNGLSEYVSHLREEEHKEKAEKRKDDLENNRLFAPINSLFRFRDTFMFPSKKVKDSKDFCLRKNSFTSSKQTFPAYNSNRSGMELQGNKDFNLPTYSNIPDNSCNFGTPFSPAAGRGGWEEPQLQGEDPSSGFHSRFLPMKSNDPHRGSEFHHRYLSSPGFNVEAWNHGSLRFPNTFQPYRDDVSYGDHVWHQSSPSNHCYPNHVRHSQLNHRQKAQSLEGVNEEDPVSSSTKRERPQSQMDFKNHYRSPLHRVEQDKALKKWRKALKSKRKSEDFKNLSNMQESFSGLFAGGSPDESALIKTWQKPLKVQDLSTGNLGGVKDKGYKSSLQKKNGTVRLTKHKREARKSVPSLSVNGFSKPSEGAKLSQTSKRKVLLETPKRFELENNPNALSSRLKALTTITIARKTAPMKAEGSAASAANAFSHLTSATSSSCRSSSQSSLSASSAPELSHQTSSSTSLLNVPPNQSTSSTSSSLTKTLSQDHFNQSKSSTLCDIGERSDLRKKFRQIIDDLDPPSTLRSVSSSTCGSLATSSGLSTEPTYRSSDAFNKRTFPRVVLHDFQKSVFAPKRSGSSSRDREPTIRVEGAADDEIKSEVCPFAAEVIDSSFPASVSSKQLQKDSVKRTSGSPEESAKLVRNELLKLAEKKHLHQQQNTFDPTTTEDDNPEASSRATVEEDRTDGDERFDSETDDTNTSEGNKKKISCPVPNIAKARSRVKVGQQQVGIAHNDSDGDKKQTRIAKLLLTMGARSKPSTQPRPKSPQKLTKKKISGPRFGIGLAPHESESADFSLDESDLEDIVMSIKEAEDLQDKASLSAGSKRMRSVSEGEAPTDSNASNHGTLLSFSKSSQEENTTTFKTIKASSKHVSNPRNKQQVITKENVIASEDDAPKAVQRPKLSRSRIRKSVETKSSSREHSNDVTPSSSLQKTTKPSLPPAAQTHPAGNPLNPVGVSPEDLSTTLLHMSEREELLHSQDNQIKAQSKKTHNELEHVHLLIEQLMVRKKELEEEVNKIDEEEKRIKEDLENIRQSRLSLLRGSVNVSAPLIPPHETPQFRPNSCAHSTPTPPSRPGLSRDASSSQSIIASNSSFPNSQSTIEKSSLRNNDDSRYDTALTGINFDLSGHVTTNIKSETNPEPDPPSKPEPVKPNSEPFPVASGSVYFDSQVDNVKNKAVTSSINTILKKYLKDASSEREVTSSTTPPKSGTSSNRSRLKAPSNSARTPSDYDVTSTTQNKDVPLSDKDTLRRSYKTDDVTSPGLPNLNKASTTKKRRNVLPSDPRLAELALQQPSPSDVTKSWVTAHDVTHDPARLTPVKLTNEQASIAELQALTVAQHSTPVLNVFVTDCMKIITCAKDKSLCISDATTGRLLKTYEFLRVPFKSFMTMDTCKNTHTKHSLVSLFVVFIEETSDRRVSTECSVHKLQIKMNNGSRPSDTTYQFNLVKLLDYDDCVLFIHPHNELLYLGTKNGRVAIFDTTTLQVKDTLDCHSPHAIHCLTTGTEGPRRVLCCGSSDCRVSVRDADDGLLLKTLSGHTKTVNCMQLKNELLYSGASDRTVLVHNIHTGDVVYRFVGMHGGSVKSLHIERNSVISLCLDKSVRVLRTEPCRVSGPPKPVDSPPVSMFVHHTTIDGYCNVVVPYAYVGCIDGKVKAVPLTQIAYKVDSQKANDTVTSCEMDASVPADDFNYVDLANGLDCLWSGCGGTGFTTGSALLTHINLFHATEEYKEKLNSCCLWGNCTHYFSSDLDTALDVHLHMDKHVHEEITNNV